MNRLAVVLLAGRSCATRSFARTYVRFGLLVASALRRRDGWLPTSRYESMYVYT